MLLIPLNDPSSARCCGPFPSGNPAAPIQNALAPNSLLPKDARVCCGEACAAFRVRHVPLSDPAWKDAVVLAAEEIGDKSPGRGKAVAHVNANKAQYGIPDPTHGYCGLAGGPS